MRWLATAAYHVEASIRVRPERLEELLDDPDTYVSAAAATSLGSFRSGAKRAVPNFIGQLPVNSFFFHARHVNSLVTCSRECTYKQTLTYT